MPLPSNYNLGYFENFERLALGFKHSGNQGLAGAAKKYLYSSDETLSRLGQEQATPHKHLQGCASQWIQNLLIMKKSELSALSDDAIKDLVAFIMCANGRYACADNRNVLT